MPIGYTEAYAKRLDEASALTVVEAREGELVRPGVVFVAPAGRHLTFSRDATGAVRIRLDISPLDTPIARPLTSCSSLRLRCTATACSAS